ncbi:cannabinoid receptor 2 [Anguilla anguilla]|uniref:cannabinoid receptor 2 n=1 Tax=Anguilla anguilla TaxID=7936 RepID=UPI0015A9FE6F|nr:cannabinoid receptor 2 [Anguilla anguilla]
MEELGQVYPSEATPPCNVSHAPPAPPSLAAANESCADLSCYMVLTEAEKTAIGSICFLAGPATFLENVLVLGVIAASRRLRRRPSYLFIGSLALADVFASCFFTSIFLDFHLFRRRDGRHAYLFKLGGVTLAFTGSVGSLLLTALDRYVCIHHAPSYKAVLTRRRALLGLAALWAVTALVAFLPLLGWTCPTGLVPPCSRLFPYIHSRYLACWTGFMLALLGLILAAYALVLWRAHQHEASMVGLGGGACGGGGARMRMDIRLARTLGLILLILAGCWLPVLSFMLADVSQRLTRAHQRAFAFCSTLCLVNSAVNPLLYALRCRELRQALARLLKQGRGRCRGRRGRGNSREGTGAPSQSITEGNGSSPGSEEEALGESLSEAVEKKQLAVIRK